MAGKWNVGSLQVNGQVMFGDNNQMHVNLPALNAADQDKARTALTRMSIETEKVAQQQHGALSDEQRVELHRAVQEVIDELKKPNGSDSVGLIKRCLEQVIHISSAIPPILSAALELKGVLGI